MLSNLDLKLWQHSSLVFMFGHDLHQREPQHAGGIGVFKVVELLLQDIADAVEVS
jgi:hypothetical protein